MISGYVLNLIATVIIVPVKQTTRKRMILEQIFVPVCYVEDRYKRIVRLFDDFKKLQDTASDVYYTCILV